MAVGKLTKRSVEALATPEKGRAFLWDDTLKGFGVMLTHKGQRSYVVQYRIGGREGTTQRATIGQHGNPWTQETARARAVELLDLVRRKIDPVQADRDRLALEREGKANDERYAFSTAADLYIAHLRQKGLKSADEIAAIFERDLKPHFLQKPLHRIKRADIHTCTAAVGLRSKSSANRAHSWLRAMLNWAVDQDRFGIHVSPMEKMAQPFESGKRERVLTDAELSIILDCIHELSEPHSSFMLMLVFTAQRRNEVAGMRWEELDIDSRQWLIPGSRTKNKIEHLLPLSLSAVEAIELTEPELARRQGFVFTSNGKKAVASFSECKRNLDKLIADRLKRDADEAGVDYVPMPSWVLHDLRRTVATGLQRMGTRIEYTEALLNHVSGSTGGLVGIYQRYKYWPEKVDAMAAWDRQIDEIRSGKGLTHAAGRDNPTAPQERAA
ncbi:tyrosine-type recombinase/integrase [Polymorphobacter fuscus]|uniref:Tyrosine-type recombinase/integrase n=1 Tax=Sandarakinorhabdus fusca TaxID=1439888 RepID=A0A7C9GW62_9SPHN|nr:site-specific integrase [Polymorphobacter fuscus]KAB7645554.1 tyrosine-type recombinase/integrase [Polymorphobacter fuscus]MQT17998.1 tyrosine-type recombinase/integrase [Polymorphobacter fuscus]NJC08626.1 integrase [Polymorphobacter fuscus]